MIIKTLKDYPDNGKHQECNIGLPFLIRKGEDGYYYTDAKGKERKYNLFKSEDKVDDRWIVHLTEGANESLKEIFKIKVNKDLNKIVKYCREIYCKSLKLEIKKMNKYLNDNCNKK